MAFGLGKKKSSDKGAKKAAPKKAAAKSKQSNSQAAEAKALLEKMNAKKAAGDCPFC